MNQDRPPQPSDKPVISPAGEALGLGFTSTTPQQSFIALIKEQSSHVELEDEPPELRKEDVEWLCALVANGVIDVKSELIENCPDDAVLEAIFYAMMFYRNSVKEIFSTLLRKKELQRLDALKSDLDSRPYFEVIWNAVTGIYFKGESTASLCIVGLEAVRNIVFYVFSQVELMQRCFHDVVYGNVQVVHFDPLDPALKIVLDEYARIGKFIAADPICTNFHSALFDATALNKGTLMPFGFICAPSGTGKTNFAIATPRPYLYFTYFKNNSDQSIYECFDRFSSLLSNLLDEDVRIFFKINKKRRKYKETEASYEAVKHRDSEELLIVGFLVEMVKALWRGYSQGSNAAQVQVNIRTISFKKMSLQAARAELFPTGKNEIFTIYIDECSLEAKDSSYGALRFAFLRSIIRLIGCVPVFLGTNAKAANFVAANKLKRSSRHGPSKIWAVILSQLPTANSDYLKEIIEGKDGIKGKLALLPTPSMDLLDMTFDMLSKEFPLFVKLAIDFFEALASQLVVDPEYHGVLMGKSELTDEEVLEIYFGEFPVNTIISSDKNIFSHLFGFILRYLQIRKTDEHLFNLGQLAYIFSHCWNGSEQSGPSLAGIINEYKGENGKWKRGLNGKVVLNEKLLSSDRYINTHLAYLNCKSSFSKYPGCTFICSDVKSDGTSIVRYYGSSGKEEFKPTSKYLNFHVAPATGFVCTGIYSDHFKTVIHDWQPRSIIHAVINDYERMRASPGSAIPGYPFEKAVTCGMVIASHAGGLHGCSLKVFLQNLIRELDYHAEYTETKKYKIDFDQNFKPAKEVPFIPYCAPMASDTWNEHLLDNLHRLFFKTGQKPLLDDDDEETRESLEMEPKESMEVEASELTEMKKKTIEPESIVPKPDMKMGIVYPSLNKEPVDCLLAEYHYVMDAQEGQKVSLQDFLIVAESKMHFDPLTPSVLSAIMNKFDRVIPRKEKGERESGDEVLDKDMATVKITTQGKEQIVPKKRTKAEFEQPTESQNTPKRKTPLFLIVCKSVEDNLKYWSTTGPLTYCLWRLTGVGSNFSTVLLNPLQDTSASRHVLIVELCKVDTAVNVKDKYKYYQL